MVVVVEIWEGEVTLRKGGSLLATLEGNPIYLDPDFIWRATPSLRNPQLPLFPSRWSSSPLSRCSPNFGIAPRARSHSNRERNSREDLAGDRWRTGRFLRTCPSTFRASFHPGSNVVERLDS